MIKAVIFDLDGTLVNSLEDLAASTNFALGEFGFPVHEIEKYNYFVGDGMQKLIERVLPENARDTETKAQVFDAFWNHYKEHYVDKTKAYNGIKELLQNLKEKKIKLIVISNKAEEMAITVVNKLLPDIFDLVCGKVDNYPAKPDPSLTNKIISDMGLVPSDCVFVGDSGMDAATAVNVGCVGIGVLWGFRTEDELKSNGADYIVNNPSEILDIIKEL